MPDSVPSPLTPQQIAEVAEWFACALDYPAAGQVPPAAPAALARWLDAADALLAQRDRATYCGLFDIGKPEPPVPLLESHYHRDPAARLRRVVNFYRAYGVVQDPHHAPDHLCVEMAYLAYLARVAAMYPLRGDLADAVRAFARLHPGSFAWRCLKSLRQHDDAGVFVALYAALARFLADVGGETSIPFADDGADADGQPAGAVGHFDPRDARSA